MTVVIAKYENTAHIVLSGHFNFYMQSDFKQGYQLLLGEPMIRQIDVDMSLVEFIDSTAIGMLALLVELARIQNKSVCIVHPSKAVARLFDMRNMNKLIAVSG